MQSFTAGDTRRADAVLPGVGIFRILVCRSSHSLGNTLFITPLLQEIEAKWPGAEVDLITRYPSSAQIFSSYSSVRNIFALPKRFFSHPMQWIKTIRTLRRVRYDLVIDTDVRSRTGRYLLRVANARYKLGFAGRGALTIAVDAAQAPKHAAHFPVYLLRQAVGDLSQIYPPLAIRLTKAEIRHGRTQIAKVTRQRARTKAGVVGIFANATGPKAMTPDWWTAFMQIAQMHLHDFEIVEIVPAFGQSMLGSRYPAYFSSDIGSLAKFMSSLSIVICLDCGIMHLARASGACVAAVFTTTDVAVWGPYGEGAYYVHADKSDPAAAASRLMSAVPLFTPVAA